MAAIFPLLPNTDQANYGALVEASKASEGLVNGTWNSYVHAFHHCRVLTLIISLFNFRILSVRFPTNLLVWSINPELLTPDGFPDLLVTHNHFTPLRRPWTVLYEGKSSTSGDTFDAIRGQLNGYAHGLAHGQFVYWIGAKGRECIFCRYTKDNLVPDERMSADVLGNVSFKTTGDFVKYDIVLAQGQISAMLFYIFTHPPP